MDIGRKPKITPSLLGQYISHSQCGKFALLQQIKRNEGSLAENWEGGESFSFLSPILSQEGIEFESQVEDELGNYVSGVVSEWKELDSGQLEVNEKKIKDKADLCSTIDSGKPPIMLYQAPFGGEIEDFRVYGEADIILIWPGNPVRIRVIDVKASWKEKSSHRIQVGAYTKLLRNLLEGKESVPAVDFDYTIEGGVLYRESKYDTVDPDKLPKFNLDPIEDDVERLLSSDGRLFTAMNDTVSNISYTINNKCKSCEFNEYCHTDAVESGSLALLGVSPSNQRILEDVGIKDIYDLAGVVPQYDWTEIESPSDIKIKKKWEDEYEQLKSSTDFTESIKDLAQKAQMHVGEVYDQHPNSYTNKPPTSVGSGRNEALPEDDPYDENWIEYKKKGLIKVFLNVQIDYIQDRIIGISSFVDSGRYEGELKIQSELTSKLPPSSLATQEKDEYERDLLQRTLPTLFEHIEEVAQESGYDDEAPIHLYFYTQEERDALYEAVDRHPGVKRGSAIKDLIGLREQIDQRMVSYIEPVFESVYQLPTNSTGIVQTYNQFTYWDDEYTPDHIWEYEMPDGTTVDLKEVFRTSLFGNTVPYYIEQHGNTPIISMFESATGREHPDDYYPARGRWGAQVPLEYIWFAKEYNTVDIFPWVEDPDDQNQKVISKYRDIYETGDVISKQHVRQLLENFVRIIRTMERSLHEARDFTIEKKPIKLNDIQSFSLGEPSLKDSLQEFLELEFQTSKREHMQQYGSDIPTRIANGEAIPVQIEDFIDNGGLKTILTETAYEELGFEDPDSIIEGAKISEGDRLIATPLTKTPDGNWQYEDDISHYTNLPREPNVSIQNWNKSTNKIALEQYPSTGGKFTNEHKRFEKSPDGDWTRNADSGRIFILDPVYDDITSERSYLALNHAEENNMLYYKLVKMAEGESFSGTTFDRCDVDSALTDMIPKLDYEPNEKQKEFIQDTTSPFKILQGPPGTGKTSGALSNNIIARATACENANIPLSGVVTAASNTAIDEVLEDVLLTKQKTEMCDGLTLIRACSSKPKEEDQLDGVEYLSSFEDAARIQTVLESCEQNQSKQESLFPSNFLIFTTPATLFKMYKTSTFGDEFDGDDDTEKGERPFMKYRELFNLLCVDEASMMQLPDLLLSGSFITDDAQVILSGDQRQMPPVTKHNWDEEDRRTIIEVAPFLSSLNYFRLLRGETIETLPETVQEHLPSYDANITVHRLEKTYRCHEDVADFLREAIYMRKDDINYRSDQTETIDPPQSNDKFINTVLDPDASVVVITHDDRSGKQANTVEAEIVSQILNNTPEGISKGTVTPHNAQKGLIKSIVDRDVEVDTVERFQGGERDLMLLSSTVSDPEYLDAESDFILDPNRLNVALSRMKKKLVIIVPKTLFRLIPNDTDEYEQSIIWKELYNYVGVGDKNPDWKGKLNNLSKVHTKSQTKIEVYQK